MSDVSICIVNYNTRDLLLQCISSLYASTKNISFEVIIVDNNSVDGSCEIVEKSFASVRLIKNQRNLGFGKANNQAMSLSRGEYILLLNSDTIVRPGALERLVAFLEQNPHIGLVGPRLLNEDGSVQASISNFPNLWFVFIRMFKLRSLFPLEFFKRLAVRYSIFGSMVKSYLQVEGKAPISVENISGACMLLRKSIVEQVGGFDENYFMYMEDADLCRRITASRSHIYYLPQSEIIHLVGKSSGSTFRDQSPVSYESLYYFMRKHYGAGTEVMVRGIVLAAITLRGSLSFLLHPVATVRGENLAFNNYSVIIARALKRVDVRSKRG